MKISHRQLHLILRILYCLGAFFGVLVFIYELFIQRSISYTICYICYLIVNAAILYLLFARTRPNSRFAYGTFYAMCFVTVLFFLSYIYESATLVSKMKTELIDHIEHNKEVTPPIRVMIRLSKCCSIDDERHTNENFLSFQIKYPDTCGKIELNNAQSCLPFIRNQRNFTIFLCCIMLILRLLTLILLWKYITDEYNGNYDESMNFSINDGERSTASVIA